MIATPVPRSWRAVRIGSVQPLSAVLPAVLRQYGLQLPPETIPPDVTARGESCGPDESAPAACISSTVGLSGCAALRV